MFSDTSKLFKSFSNQPIYLEENHLDKTFGFYFSWGIENITYENKDRFECQDHDKTWAFKCLTMHKSNKQ